MHEMSLCEGVIQIIEEAATEQAFDRVKAVWLEVGALSGVDVSALSFCFDVVRQKSIANEASLHIINTPAVAWCMKCAQNTEIKQRFDACIYCGSHQLQVVSGDEMKIKELEVE